MDRREFLSIAAGTVATGILGGCASVVSTPVTPEAGRVRLPIRDYPQLAHPGGYLKIAPVGAASPIYVLALDRGEYAALSPICTHLGCTVNVEGAELVCPCHGSMYDREGRVLRGPAERALRRFPVTLSPGGVLVIELGDGA